jgi:hypothetical protein
VLYSDITTAILFSGNNKSITVENGRHICVTIQTEKEKKKKKKDIILNSKHKNKNNLF